MRGFVLDTTVTCISSCYVLLPPGLDGTYHVFVDGDNGVVHGSTA